MKLELIDADTDDAADQILRLYNFSAVEAARFQQAIHQTLLTEGKPLDLTKLVFIEPLNCKLVLCLSDKDKGITSVGNGEFICELTTAGYETMVELGEPFCNGVYGFQFLYNIITPIDFLFSVDGAW